MSPFDSIILGIIEGLTEFLPVSSTGHLILGGELLNITDTEFLKSFSIFIQVGAICAVIFLYAKKIFSDFNIIKKVTIAFIPTAIIGFLLYGFAKKYLLGSSAVVLWALFIGGIILILFEMWYEKRKSKLTLPEEIQKEVTDITNKQAFFVGVFQALAIIPGVSRSGATILGGLALGVSRVAIVEFSFLLAIPTIIGATALDLFKSNFVFTQNEILLLFLGFVTSFFVAILAIKTFLRFIRNNSFIVFGVYRIILALIFFLVFGI